MKELAQRATAGFVATTGEGLSSLVPFAQHQSGCSTYIVVDRSNVSMSYNPAHQQYIGC